MATGKIIVLSHEGDAHLKYVTDHLQAEEVLLINPTDMLDGDTIDFMLKGDVPQVFYKDELLSDIKSIWIRRPTILTSRSLPVRGRHVAYVRSAAERHLNMLYVAFPNALWLSNMAALKAADVKLWQLQLAAKMGFNVPDTLFASTPRRAKAFVDSHGICIAKTQTQKLPIGSQIFTKILRSTDKLDYTNLRLDPYTFQQYIEPKAEWRITVVGDQVFAAEVGGEGTDGLASPYRDWRVSHMNKTFTAKAVDPPKDFIQQCIRFVKALELEFGALDFIIDKDNKIWFLEINPNGQWAFVERKTGQPIGKAIADKLIAGKVR
jgi:glutathione synthase/RimK-type ligase-like ATP-grasp enzyme